MTMGDIAELVAANPRVQQLEADYIALLEKRIKALEALSDESDSSTSKDGKSRLPGKGKNATTPGTKKNGTNDGQAGDSDSDMFRLRQRILFKEGVPEENDLNASEFDSLERHSLRSNYKLTWYRVLTEKMNYKFSEFNVDSIELQELLRFAISHYPKQHFPNDGVEDSLTFSSPFKPLVHNWDKLEALSDAESLPYQKLKARALDSGPRTEKQNDPLASALILLGKDDHLEKARHQLGQLMSRIKSTRELNPYFAGLEGQKKGGSIQFDHLWTIFPPGEVVYSEVFMGQPQLFLVKDMIKDELDEDLPYSSKRRSYRLICWSYDWNGVYFHRVPIEFSFDEFHGSRAIETLVAYPLSYRTNTQGQGSIKELEALLRRRGQRFRELCIRQRGRQMFDYEGDAVIRGAGFQKLGRRREGDEGYTVAVIREIFSRRVVPQQPAAKTSKIEGRVMVDFAAYLQHVPGRSGRPMGDAVLSNDRDECRCSTCSVNQSLRDNQKIYWDGATGDTEFEDLQYMLCPPRVLGYHLENKAWVELNISLDEGALADQPENAHQGKLPGKYLRDIAQLTSAEAFSKLQLAPSQKNLVQAMVESHSSGTMDKPLMEDIMKGKGRGLVILLHGPPGVGKTLTAESVAQLAGKPLFSVGVSDIGLNPEDVERNLEALFELAANWRAVLLFDEADVFLESRSSHTSDLNRNALVSVLLRVLEYYDGILILTTNRIREFDVAVQSRVNLGIMYDDLDPLQKIKIIENFLNQLKPDNVEGKQKIIDWFLEDEDGDRLIKSRSLNGRQVRNILFSAASLAMKDGKVLTLDHVKRMAKATYLFNDSIKAIVDAARRKAEAKSDF